MFFGILKIWDFFGFFEFFWLLDPPRCTERNFSPEKIPRGMLKTCLNTFENVFGHFEKMKVFKFFEVFPSLDLPGCTGQFFLRKLPQNKFETCLDTSKNVLDTFEKSIFFVFSSNFYKIRSPGCTGPENFGKNYLKQVWTLLERFFGILELWNLFDFCGTFSSLQGALGRVFFRRNNHATHSQTMFLGTFSDNFESFEVFVFLKFFPSFDPPRCTGDFFSKQNYLKTGSKHVWTILGTVLDTLEILNFSIFSNLSLTWPSRVHCAKFLPKKLPRN